LRKKKKNNATGDIKEETRGGMDAELKAQAEKAWAMLMKARPPSQASPEKLSDFMRLMHGTNNIDDRKLMKVMRTFPRGDSGDERWAGPRGQITGHGIAKALVGLLNTMIGLGQSGFMATVFMTQKGFDARYVTCLFVCGLIEHEHMSFQNLDLDAAEYVIGDTDDTGPVDLDEAEGLVSAAEIGVPDVLDKFAFSAGRTPESAEAYTTQLMRLLLAPVKYIDLHKLGGGDASAIPGDADAVPANLFVADGAPTGDRVCILDALESTKWSDYLLRRHTITSKAELWYVFFMWLCRGPEKTVGSYGVKIGAYSCIFIYNLPMWAPQKRDELQTERGAVFRKYIEQPVRAYTASLNWLKIEAGDVVSKLETVSFNVIGLLYIHLLVMARVAAARDPKRRFFTAPRAGERALVQDALCLTGETYGGIKATLPYMRDAKAFPFVYQEADRKTQAIDRLAVAHLALMAEGGPESIDFAAGTVASTCRVRYAWVFGYPELMRGGTFPQELRKRVGELEVDSPRMAVYRCVYDLIEGHLSDDEKAFYVKKFTAAATTGSAAPSRAESEERAASGGGDGGDGGGFSDRDTTSDGSGASEPVFGRAGVGEKGDGGGGKQTTFDALVGLLARVDEQTRIESAVLHEHVDELKKHTAISGYSIADSERLLALLKSELTKSNASLVAGLAEIRALSLDIAAQHAAAETEQAAARSAHEQEVAALQVQLDGLTAKLQESTLRADTLQGEKEELERRLAELQRQLAALEAEKSELTAQLEAHTASKADLLGATATEKLALEETLAKQGEEIERLKERVAELERELAALKVRFAESEAALATMTSAKEALERDLEVEKEAHLKKIRALERKTAEAEDAHRLESARYRKENRQLRVDSERQENVNEEKMKWLTTKLQDHLNRATQSFGADMKTVHDTTTAATKKQKGLALLTDLLKKEEYTGFNAGVVPAETVKVEYSLPALFLICESIAGTWKMKKEGVSETVTEKLAYDCRVYDSIEQDALNQSRIKEYTSPLFQEFVAAVKSAQV
jgi:hypothetical protein